MPDGVLDVFMKCGTAWINSVVEQHHLPGDVESGLQALWLKRKKPEIFSKIRTVLHLPQY